MAVLTITNSSVIPTLADFGNCEAILADPLPCRCISISCSID